MEKIHYAIDKKNLLPKSNLLENILNNTYNLRQFKDKKGLLFSNTILEKFIDEEVRHDIKFIDIQKNRSIRTFSSGEQKKALLNFLIQQKPDYLILDSLFDSLDIASVSELQKQLINLSVDINLIQILNREEELLPIITHVLDIKNDKIVNTIAIKEYNFTEKYIDFKGEVPQPITIYKNIPNQLIKLEKVIVNYAKNCILKNINWTINKNEFWQLIGPNGSGKTTILSMIYGNNVKAFRQEVYLFGKKKGSGESIWDIKEKIGYFNPTILELFTRKQTAIQMILSGFFDSIGLYMTPTTLQIKLAEKWINLLNLEDEKDLFFQNLSITSQRLILIARAMIKHPPLLILDEPLINLDNNGTNIIVTLINKIALKSETTIIFVSHRKVKNLQPDYTYELIPSLNGSLGNVKK